MFVCEPVKVSRFLERWVKMHPGEAGAFDQCEPCPNAAMARLDASDKAFDAALRRYRHAELARIAYRDLAGLDDLESTLGALTRLADDCIETALRRAELEVRDRHGRAVDDDGRPVRMIIIGMGKLGGFELNFSSDIDLIFSYDGAAIAEIEGDIDVGGYFRRIAQCVIKRLSKVTAQGLVYRVDTRLRPFGDVGAMVSSIVAMEQYYQAHGREWERYAWIKARPVAGDITGGRKLIDILRPFVYRRYLDYGAVESIREMKALIDREVVRRELQADIKLGYGGIREVEFIAQVFQLIRGGQEPELQGTRLRPTLAKLAEAGHLERPAAQQLDDNYVFLRRLENRLQMVEDRQTHELPDDTLEQERVAVMMGMVDVSALLNETKRVREQVHDLFESIFALSGERDESNMTRRDREMLTSLWQNELAADAAGNLLSRYGIVESPQVLDALTQLREQRGYRGSDSRGKRWLTMLVPAVIEAASHNDSPSRAALRTLKVVSEIIGRSNYIALLVEYPAALATLIRLCAASEWITSRIAAQPTLLDSFLDPQQLYHPPNRTELAEELAADLSSFDEDDLEQRMDALRRFTQRTMLSVAAADVTNAMPLMIVSDHLTELAELALDAALSMAWHEMRRRYGAPLLADGSLAPFTVIGYGKLGGLELGYQSDLDLVFLYDSPAQDATRGGPRELTHQVFFTRLAQRIIHILSIATPAGRVYEIDMRLRPSGDAGLMVSSFEAFVRYQHDRAWTWEHQALVRARPVAGDEALGRRFIELRSQTLGQQRDRVELAAEVAGMRARMRNAKDTSTPTHWDIKQMPGGMVDIEFMAQYAVLAHGHECPELMIFTDAIRILETMESARLASYGDIRDMARAYRDYRRVAHAAALQRQHPMIKRNGRREARRLRIAGLWDEWVAAMAVMAPGANRDADVAGLD